MTKHFAISQLVAAFGFALLVAGPAFSASSTPDGTIRTFYAAYGLGSDPQKNGLDDRLAAQTFERGLAGLYRRAGEANVLDSDFFIQGQDWNMTQPVQTSVVPAKDNRSMVTALLQLNDGGSGSAAKIRTEVITFRLVKAADGWRIANAFHKGRSVRQEWAQALRERSRRPPQRAQSQRQNADAGLNRTYKALMKKASNKALRKALRTAQRAWIAFRNKECELEAHAVRGGSVHSSIVVACRNKLAEVRAKELGRFLNCQEGNLSCPF